MGCIELVERVHVVVVIVRIGKCQACTWGVVPFQLDWNKIIKVFVWTSRETRHYVSY